jgi:hypothetical protein
MGRIMKELDLGTVSKKSKNKTYRETFIYDLAVNRKYAKEIEAAIETMDKPQPLRLLWHADNNPNEQRSYTADWETLKFFSYEVGAYSKMMKGIQ